MFMKTKMKTHIATVEVKIYYGDNKSIMVESDVNDLWKIREEGGFIRK